MMMGGIEVREEGASLNVRMEYFFSECFFISHSHSLLSSFSLSLSVHFGKNQLEKKLIIE